MLAEGVCSRSKKQTRMSHQTAILETAQLFIQRTTGNEEKSEAEIPFAQTVETRTCERSRKIFFLERQAYCSA